MVTREKRKEGSLQDEVQKVSFLAIPPPPYAFPPRFGVGMRDKVVLETTVPIGICLIAGAKSAGILELETSWVQPGYVWNFDPIPVL